MSLPTSRKSVETLRNSLQAKAKSEPSYRFYSCGTRFIERTFFEKRIAAAGPMPEWRAWMRSVLR